MREDTGSRTEADAGAYERQRTADDYDPHEGYDPGGPSFPSLPTSLAEKIRGELFWSGAVNWRDTPVVRPTAAGVVAFPLTETVDVDKVAAHLAGQHYETKILDGLMYVRLGAAQ